MIATAFLLLPLLSQASAVPIALPPEVLTNEHIVRMVDAGLPADFIEAQIKRSVCKFHTDTDALVSLAAHKVPDPVIGAMMACASAASATSAIPAPAIPTAALTGLPTNLPATFSEILYKPAPGVTCQGALRLTEEGFEFRAVEKCMGLLVVSWSAIKRYCYRFVTWNGGAPGLTFFGRRDGQWLFWTDDSSGKDLAAIARLLRRSAIPVKEMCY